MFFLLLCWWFTNTSGTLPGLPRAMACLLTTLFYFHWTVKAKKYSGHVHTLAEYQPRTNIYFCKENCMCTVPDMMMNCIWNSHAAISSSLVTIRWGKLCMGNSHSVHSCTNTRVHTNCCTEMRKGKVLFGRKQQLLSFFPQASHVINPLNIFLHPKQAVRRNSTSRTYLHRSWGACR